MFLLENLILKSYKIMDIQLKNQITTLEDYLVFENSAETKHEFHDGKIVAMPEVHVNHNRITINSLCELMNKLENTCFEAFSNLKLKVGQNFFYPDLMIVGDKNDAESDMYRTAPVLIVEVLSKSTTKLDHTYKRQQYKTIPSLEEYVLIDQDKAKVTVFTCKDGWQVSYYFLDDEIYFYSLDVTVFVEDLYHRVDNEDMLEFLQTKNQITE